MDVAVCSHFARSIASILVFLKSRSLGSLTWVAAVLGWGVLEEKRRVGLV